MHEERVAALEAARVGQAKAAATARNAVASRGKCEAVIAGPLAALEAGALADSAGAKAHAAELVGLGKELSFDQSLLISLPMALVKKPGGAPAAHVRGQGPRGGHEQLLRAVQEHQALARGLGGRQGRREGALPEQGGPRQARRALRVHPLR